MTEHRPHLPPAFSHPISGHPTHRTALAACSPLLHRLLRQTGLAADLHLFLPGLGQGDTTMGDGAGGGGIYSGDWRGTFKNKANKCR